MQETCTRSCFFLRIYLANREIYIVAYFITSIDIITNILWKLVSIDRVTAVGPNPFSERLNDGKSTSLLSLSF